MIKRIAIIVAALTVTACTDEAATRRTLEDEGYTDIVTTGYRLGCGDDDQFSTGFRAKRNGKPVEGVVCCGLWFKGCTVRH